MRNLATPLSPQAGPFARLARVFARIRAREAVAGLIAPLLIAAALALLHLAGLFALLDARFFDAVTTGERGTAPQVVVIERDPRFEARGVDGMAQLEASLAARGVERIGHLGARPAGLAMPGVPVITGALARQLPASGRWILPANAARSTSGAEKSAPQLAGRAMAPADYGIQRSQFGTLTGIKQTIPAFDSALAGRVPARETFLVRMSRQQNIPAFSASQLIAGELAGTELDQTVALVADAGALEPRLSTALSPHSLGTSEAEFRAHAIQTLRSNRAVYPASRAEVWLLLLVVGAVLALAFRRIDPKRLAIALPLSVALLAVLGSWAALQFGGKLLPVTAMIAAPWIVTFQRVLSREMRQDRRLEGSASRAIEHSFRRSALREGARLPEFLGFAARIAGVERSLLIERQADGKVDQVVAQNASIDDLALSRKQLSSLLGQLRGSVASRDASQLVPSWPGAPRIAWLDGAGSDHYWIYSEPVSRAPARSAQLVRAIADSFRQLFRWRSDINARSHQDERFVPVDDKVASAIALVARESEQVRNGFDSIDTAVMIFHLIGSPLHANAQMRDIYREAGLVVSETSLTEVLVRLTDLDTGRIEAMLQDLVLNGGEMRMPMVQLGAAERVLRLAAPARIARGSERVLVLEALDVAHLNRAADLRQAVALFIDLQLRNDFEAILLGADLGANAKVNPEQLRAIVERIGATARRGTERLDEVAQLVRADNSELVDACYPVDAREIVNEALARTQALADELGVTLTIEMPSLSGFTIAEPRALVAMLEAMLRVVIADTPQGDAVTLRLEEGESRTHIRVSGGFGIGFGRLMWLLTNYETEAVGEYRVIGEGMAKAVGWDGSVSYWGREADGFGFNIDLRRIG